MLVEAPKGTVRKTVGFVDEREQEDEVESSSSVTHDELLHSNEIDSELGASRWEEVAR